MKFYLLRESLNEVENSVENLPGIGKATAQRLQDSGYQSIESLAIAKVQDICEAAEVSESKAEQIVEEAKKSSEIGEFKTAEEILKERGNVGWIRTGSDALDNLLGGGIETQSVTEIFGEFGSGKTQLAHQLSVNVQLPKDKGGLNGKAIYMDTENTFRPHRILSMAEGLDLDSEETLKSIFVAKPLNTDHQLLLAEKAQKIVKDEGVRLLVVDTLTSLFRAEYVGREVLAERQQKLGRHLLTLHRIADLNNVSVVVANQVHAKPDAFLGDPTQPIGGHVLGHSATSRIYLRKSKGTRRIARVVDSPELAEGEAVFRIATEGIRD
ncbi:DNA repair and recombination protein RadA [candidate division MSBL1 archaeon SCGC-AAA261F19]|uniref:DNA repair and recombination protein RadA n=2 Tax=candidate division MSBL1 TaxID=215777 RepID=A0A133VBP7_9EURY|nr:DNA repair and recombination protein RadA [candidate division MSBL1 archaeon SCGC-AAA261D19]KXB03882.1 DNA repair and recombination protein RadA [candidate division MSBL1 archaeon SCGC-AAA261F19]